MDKLDKKELVKTISELYKKFKPVKDYLDFYLNPDEKHLLEEFKRKVTEGFFPKRGDQLKLSVSRKAINDFKKLGTSLESLADLLLHFVENGVEFTNEFGDIDEKFYASIEKTYSNALDIVDENGLLEKFEKRAYKIVAQTEGIGWGVHDYLGDVYYEHYS